MGVTHGVISSGDVHGCFHTFTKLINEHWNSGKLILVQLGDLSDRGKFSPETILYAIELQKTIPIKFTFLKEIMSLKLLCM